MIWTRSLELINLFLAGLLAGIEIASHYGLVTGVGFLTERSQIQLRQALVRKLRVLVPAAFFPCFLTTIYVTVEGAGLPSFKLRCAALIGYVIWILARLIATVRINGATLDWNVDAPPANWQGLIEHSERFHILSTWAVVASFAFLLLAYGAGMAR